MKKVILIVMLVSFLFSNNDFGTPGIVVKEVCIRNVLYYVTRIIGLEGVGTVLSYNSNTNKPFNCEIIKVSEEGFLKSAKTEINIIE